jgi:ABC-type branched-subunit amino acid transport system permease subunit/ABC-type branched-subunit amino acid transport system ATPase component
MLAFTINQQLVFSGLIAGLTYAVFAAGFVLIYRCTGVLNFAQGEIGAFGAALLALLVVNYSIPYWVALVFVLIACGVIGAAIELSVVRRLFNAPRIVLLIATLGVAQLLVVLKINLPDIDVEKASSFPLPFTNRWRVGSTTVLARDMLVLIVVPILILGLGLFLTRTKFGLAVRATASNPDTARVYGISVKRTSTIVWVIAAVFAGASGILLAPIIGTSAAGASVDAIGPALLLRALTVSLLARMKSLPICLLGGLAVGILEYLVVGNVDQTDRTIVDLYLFVGVLALVLFVNRSRRDEASWSLSPKTKPVPSRLKESRIIRVMPTFGFLVLFALLAAVPFVLDKPSSFVTWTEILIITMIVLSLSLLTGWAGQLSLGHFAFVGLGGLSMVALQAGHDIPVPFDLWDMSYELGWLPAVLIATAVGIVAAVIVGLPALRVRGLYLAVTTLAFAVMCQTWLFRQEVFLGRSSATPSLPKPKYGPWDFSDRRTFYFLCLAVLAVITIVVARLRRTGIGRSWIAVRENEDMASACTVSPMRMKLLAFAVSGGIAALSGCLLVTLFGVVQPEVVFDTGSSIRMVSTAIIGGLGSVAGPFLGALYIRSLPEFLGDSEQIELLTSSIGLLVLLMYFPGGLVQIVYSVRDAVYAWVDRRMGERGVPEPIPAIAKRVPTRAAHGIELAPERPWLAVEDLSVRFGGNRAVNRVTLDVKSGEIVGLIGANGAGKSTLMNAISGLVPSTGTVEVLGRNVAHLSAPRRHRLGLGRGFQAARLYPDLTVVETIMVALEARERSWLVPSMTALPPSVPAERRKRSDAHELVDFLGLGRYGDEFVANLSTGTRRIVELGCLLAVDARVLLLDEPTGGVAQRETEAFGPLIMRIRRELDASMLVIEHDMPLVMAISDRMYCLELGEVIAEGTPQEVRDNPLVIASYLGTDERAIQRSGTVTLNPSGG